MHSIGWRASSPRRRAAPADGMVDGPFRAVVKGHCSICLDGRLIFCMFFCLVDFVSYGQLKRISRADCNIFFGEVHQLFLRMHLWIDGRNLVKESTCFCMSAWTWSGNNPAPLQQFCVYAHLLSDELSSVRPPFYSSS